MYEFLVANKAVWKVLGLDFPLQISWILICIHEIYILMWLGFLNRYHL